MGTFSISYDDTKATEIVNYVAIARGYTGTAPDGTAETKAQFVRRMLVEELKRWAGMGKRIDGERNANEATYRESLGIA